MAIPAPEPGLVISYVYALAVERQPNGETLVTALPVTHRQPDDAAAAVEIPRAVKRRLGLDDARSWIVVSEGDQFVWPGYDLRKVPGSDKYDYGFLPPRLFSKFLMRSAPGTAST